MLFNYVNGDENGLLAAATVYIGNTLCAVLPDDLPENEKV